MTLPTLSAISTLRDEAIAAGDTDQARVCTAALDGYTDAIIECARVVDGAAAQEDDCDPPPTWTVYHGGSLHGLGHWSGPHATLAEARASARAGRMIVGGAPAIWRTVRIRSAARLRGRARAPEVAS